MVENKNNPQLFSLSRARAITQPHGQLFLRNFNISAHAMYILSRFVRAPYALFIIHTHA